MISVLFVGPMWSVTIENFAFDLKSPSFFNTQFLVFDTKILVYNAKFIIFAQVELVSCASYKTKVSRNPIESQ